MSATSRDQYPSTSDTAVDPQPSGQTELEQDTPWYARHRGTALMLLVTAVVGMVATCILVAERLALSADPNHVTSCDLNPWVSCGTVMKSEQAMAFGFPNQFIGLVSFSVVITVAVGMLAGARYQRWFWLGLNLGVAAGFAFCIWLWYQAVYEITALCLYCMIVWAMMAPMLVLLTVRNLHHGVVPSTPGVRKAAADWAWPVIALLYVAVIGSILLRFGMDIFQIG